MCLLIRYSAHLYTNADNVPFPFRPFPFHTPTIVGRCRPPPPIRRVADGVMELRSAAAERAGWPLVQEDESEHKDAWVDVVATDESIVDTLARFETPKDTLDIVVGSDSDALRDLVSQMQAHNAVELTSVVDNLQTPPKALRKGDRVGEIDSPEPADSPSSVLAGP